MYLVRSPQVDVCGPELGLVQKEGEIASFGAISFRRHELEGGRWKGEGGGKAVVRKSGVQKRRKEIASAQR